MRVGGRALAHWLIGLLVHWLIGSLVLLGTQMRASDSQRCKRGLALLGFAYSNERFNKIIIHTCMYIRLDSLHESIIHMNETSV